MPEEGDVPEAPGFVSVMTIVSILARARIVSRWKK